MASQMGLLVRRTSPFGSVAIDAAAWSCGLSLAVLARYEFAVTPKRLAATSLVVLLAVGLHVAIGHAHLLYRGRYLFGSFEEVRGVAYTVLCVTTALLVV